MYIRTFPPPSPQEVKLRHNELTEENQQLAEANRRYRMHTTELKERMELVLVSYVASWQRTLTPTQLPSHDSSLLTDYLSSLVLTLPLFFIFLPPSPPSIQLSLCVLPPSLAHRRRTR